MGTLQTNSAVVLAIASHITKPYHKEVKVYLKTKQNKTQSSREVRLFTPVC